MFKRIYFTAMILYFFQRLKEIGVTFQQGSSLELQNPPRLMELASCTPISFYFNVTKSEDEGKAFLFYLCNFWPQWHRHATSFCIFHSCPPQCRKDTADITQLHYHTHRGQFYLCFHCTRRACKSPL